ncbi:MAG: DEAD/DEAH box helicase [Actinomycetota bacterium]|nr:DEAD/DEAH box helicase [Actinomycetota bacterium]
MKILDQNGDRQTPDRKAPADFHPAVQAWFERRFPLGPTEPQVLAWPEIAAGRDTLIAAPTGSGKTLAAFLVCIDRLYRAFELGEEVGGRSQVVYVSPLKALAVDIQQNLEAPLAEIAALAAELGHPAPDIRVGVRNGDTPPSVRVAMTKRPPNFVITTPESLYLLLTAEKSRAVLNSVDTVIVDEIHAAARDKRGSHLALSLERLEHVCEHRPQRIGLSATQRPIDRLARLLVGTGGEQTEPPAAPHCAIVDTGHQRQLDLALELPDGELEAVASAEQLGEVLDRIAAHVLSHRTTLVFVNTRRMSERIAHLLAERLGEDAVASHHGSLSKDRRLRVEQRLRAGGLRALVATASLELGIDIGPVELVCQIGSPRSLATFLQRVGRSGHSRAGTPKGRLYPLTRDELVECAALLSGVRSGRLDAIHPPIAPLDILAQQIVAECSAQEWTEDELFALMTRAQPFAGVTRECFDEIVELVSDGIQTGRGRRGAYLHRDRVGGLLRGRRGARLAALTSGGAIPELADYRVIAEPDDTFVGTVNEDWAIESMAGDVFLLGSTSWRIRRIEPGAVRVVDAQGAPPSVPFWLGEAPARTDELCDEIASLRAGVERYLKAEDLPGARTWLQSTSGIDSVSAEIIVTYLAASRTALGLLPTLDDVIFERFFDDTGGMQLVLHAPFGGRINRGLGLALRKRFCKSFDFELQAAASDDAIVLSLGPQHSFPLPDVGRFLSSKTVEDVLQQAVLDSPMFASRWRWNLNRSLAVLRYRGGRRNPPPIQRMESDDLMAAVFPTLAACQENVSGPIPIPDHPLVRQTMYDSLHEAMDIDGLRSLIESFESGTVRMHFRDTTEPSPLAHEILSARPYTFLDDAPLEERRTRAVRVRRGLPLEATDIGRLDPEAIERVRDEVRPAPRNPDELHDVLSSLMVARPAAEWQRHFDVLVEGCRATSLWTDSGQLWTAIESRAASASLFEDARFDPDIAPPSAIASEPPPEAHTTAAAAIRGHLDVRGPATVAQLAATTGLSEEAVSSALLHLEAEGFALRGNFSGIDEEEFCARRLLARIHSYTRKRLRKEIEPVSSQDFMRFLLRWQHVAPGTQVSGRSAVLEVIEQLQGFEIPAGAWEEAILPGRIEGYRADRLDSVCLSGEVVWGRLSVRSAQPGIPPKRSAATPSRATPVSLALRADLEWLLQAVRGDQSPAEPRPGAGYDIVECLRSNGALFHADLVTASGRLPTEVEEGLWDGVARGLITADGFAAVRGLLSARSRWATRQRHPRRGLRRGAPTGARSEGRWSLFPGAAPIDDRDAVAEAVAEQLLARWGVVWRDLLARESLTLPWRDVLWAMRRLEARGTIRGGRFVSGFSGEQYAHIGAVELLRSVRRERRSEEMVKLSAADPLNLVGIVTPGARLPAVRTNSVTYVDGLPQLEATGEAAG